MSAYLAALGLTLLVELPAYVILLPELLECTRRDAWIAALAVNLTSHPVAFLVVVPLDRHALGWAGGIAFAEVAVWAGETLALSLWLRRQIHLLATVALIANGLSLAAGLLVFG